MLCTDMDNIVNGSMRNHNIKERHMYWSNYKSLISEYWKPNLKDTDSVAKLKQNTDGRRDCLPRKQKPLCSGLPLSQHNTSWRDNQNKIYRSLRRKKKYEKCQVIVSAHSLPTCHCQRQSVHDLTVSWRLRKPIDRKTAFCQSESEQATPWSELLLVITLLDVE